MKEHNTVYFKSSDAKANWTRIGFSEFWGLDPIFLIKAAKSGKIFKPRYVLSLSKGVAAIGCNILFLEVHEIP